MSRRANKVEEFFEHNPSGLQALNERCAAMVKPTLGKIVDMLNEMGLELSKPAADTYKKNTLAEFLAELKAKGQWAEAITDVAKHGLGLSDAAAVGLSRKIFDRSMEENLEDKELDQLTLSLSRLRQGDHRARLLEKRVKEYERKEIQWDEARAKAKEIIGKLEKKAGLSKEARAEIEKVLGGEAA